MRLHSKLRALIYLFAAVLSGVILAACYPGFGEIGELVWVALLPLIAVVWKVEGARQKWRLFGTGWLSGWTFFMINLKWLWTVSGLGAMALSAYLAIFWGVWAIFVGKYGNPWASEKTRRPKVGILQQGLWSLRFAVILAAAWVGQEWLRGILLTGFGWNGLGVAFSQTLVLAQGAEILGVTGLAFFPAFFAAVVVQVVVRMRDELGRGKLATRLDFGVAVLLIAVLFAFGIWRIDAMRALEKRSVPVLLMQQNIPQSLKWEAGEAERIYEGYRQGTEEAFAKLKSDNEELLKEVGEDEIFRLKNPEMVIWPESSVSEALFFDESGKQFWGFKNGNYFSKQIMPLGNFVLLSGMNNFEVEQTQGGYIRKENGKLYNAITAINSEAEVQAVYRKNHLIPFGEYIPLREQIPLLDWFFKFSAGVDFGGNFFSGESTEPMKLELLSGEVGIIPSVCFEDTVGRLARKFVRGDQQMIVNVTNDGWFKESEAARQHLANSLFRTIELRRPMARSANTGVSALIDISGSLEVSEGGHLKQRLIRDEKTGSHFVTGSYYGNVDIPLEAPLTFYARFGDVFSYLCLGGCGFLWIYRRFTRRESKSAKK